MKNKIVFIRSGGHAPGITKRCVHRDPEKGACGKPFMHRGAHSYRTQRSSDTRPESERKHHHVSTATKLDCLQMIEDPAYRKKLLRDLRLRKLRPAVECMLWYYAKGKPKEMVEHSGTLSLQEELSSLTTEQLHERALQVAAMLSGEKIH